MAKEDEKKPTAADKGKGKAESSDPKKEVKKDKDGKPIEGDKKGVLPERMFCLRSSRDSCFNRACADWEL
jgi:hypothetical protein